MTRAACGCRVGGCYGRLTANGSCSDFPGVDHEGRQACLVLISVVTQREVLVLRIARDGGLKNTSKSAGANSEPKFF